jgi:hypothetical protein
LIGEVLNYAHYQNYYQNCVWVKWLCQKVVKYYHQNQNQKDGYYL